MSTASVKDKLGDAAASTQSAAGDLKTMSERELRNARSSAEAQVKDLRSKAESNANSIRSQVDAWKGTAAADAQKVEKEAKSWFSFAQNKASDDAKKAEKEAKSWFSSAEKKGNEAAADAKSWFSSAQNQASADAKQAEKDAKSWFSSAQSQASSGANKAEKDAKSWLSSAEAKAGEAQSGLYAKANEAQSGLSSLSKEAQNKAYALQNSAEKTAADLKSRVTGISPVDPNAWVPKYTGTDYVRFFAAGALCATITHGAMTPVDVVKTRLQLEPKGSKLGMVSMARNIVATEGASGLMTGFGPTAVGYLIQGGSKFCGFEYFKAKFATMAGGREVAENNRTLIYMSAASSAELIASTLLTPLEAARIRLVSQRGYANGLAGAMTRMASEGGLREFYAGYVPILFKQIPFTMAQFTINEYMHELVKSRFDQEKVKAYGKAGEIGVSLGCGLMAGIGAAIASHPADTLLSKINKGEGGKGGQFTKLARVTRETGFAGLWAGLGARMVMQALLICAQMGIYDQIKIALDAPPAVTIAKRETSSA